MPLNNNNNNQQLYDKMLTDINQEISDMEEAERQMAAQGFSLADYSLQMATGTVRKQRIAQEQTLPPEEGFDRFKSIAPPNLYEGATPEKQQPLQKPVSKPQQLFENPKTYSEAYPEKQEPLEKPKPKPTEIGTSYDLPAHLQGSFKGEVTQETDDQGNKYESTPVVASRWIKEDGKDKQIYLIKDDDEMAKKPYVKQKMIEGKRVLYTEDPNIPGSAYKTDEFRKYGKDDPRNTFSLTDFSLGTRLKNSIL